MIRNHDYRGLQTAKIIETIERLVSRIEERFPGSGLRNVARELLAISREAVARSSTIRRPNVGMRIAILLLVGVVAAVLIVLVTQLKVNEEEIFQLEHFVQAVDSSLASLVFIGAAIIFLLNLELRLKRQRLLAAIHELRALAHIVDMHQLTKDPEQLIVQGEPAGSSPPRTMTPFELGRYLDYCSEVLSLVSKVGAIYGQDFPDPVALEAVDQLSTLTNGLARNIWQKIMILENMIGPAASLANARGEYQTEPPQAPLELPEA